MTDSIHRPAGLTPLCEMELRIRGRKITSSAGCGQETQYGPAELTPPVFWRTRVVCKWEPASNEIKMDFHPFVPEGNGAEPVGAIRIIHWHSGWPDLREWPDEEGKVRWLERQVRDILEDRFRRAGYRIGKIERMASGRRTCTY